MPQIIDVPNYGQVEFPDGMSDDDIVKAIKKNALGYKKPAQSLSSTDKVLKGLKDPFDAGAQLLTKMLPDSVVEAGNTANDWLADKTGLVPELGSGGVDQLIKRDEQQYQAQRKAQGESGFDGYRAIGIFGSPANLALASKLPIAAGVGKTVLGGMGLSAATVPVLEGDFWREKAKQAAVGGVFAPVGNALARVVSPKASVNQSVKLLQKQGVNPTIGQRLGGFVNNVEEKLSSLPILGNGIANARNTANSQFEKAAYQQVLKPIGKSMPAKLSGREAIQHVEMVLKDKYDDVLTKIGAITPDEQFSGNVSKIQGMVDDLVMPKAEKMKFANALNDVKQSIDKNGVITSEGYKKLESALGTKARKLAASQDIYDGDMAPAVKQLQQELKEMLKRQAGSHADDLQLTNSAWAKFKRVQNASSKLGADDGNFTPAQFQNAVRAMDKSKDKAAFARGGALMQDLGDAGKSVLGNKVPNSGTADRALMTGAGIYSMIDPMVGLPLLAGSSLYTQPMQRMLGASVSNRPELAVPFSKMLREGGKYVAPAATGGLFNYQQN